MTTSLARYWTALGCSMMLSTMRRLTRAASRAAPLLAGKRGEALLRSTAMVIIAQGAWAAIALADQGTPPTITITIDATVHRHRLPGDAWSPTGERFALLSRDGLALATIQAPTAPIPTVKGRIQRIAWSPDGTSIACFRQTADQARSGGRDVVRVVNGVATVVARDTDYIDLMWLSSESLWGRSGADGSLRLVAVDPGLATAAHPMAYASPSGTRMFLSSTEAGGALLPARLIGAVGSLPAGAAALEGGANIAEWVIPQSEGVHAVAANSITGTFLGFRRLPRWESVLLDSTGHVIRVLSVHADTTGMTAEAISSDGQVVLGHAPMFGDTPSYTALRALAADGSWAVSHVDAPPSLEIQVSATGNRVLLDNGRGTVYVGRLQVSH